MRHVSCDALLSFASGDASIDIPNLGTRSVSRWIDIRSPPEYDVNMNNSAQPTLKAGMVDGMLEIRITDTGSGISREDKEKIFDPLFSTKTKGTGLGLSFCKSIIAAHQGDMEVRSEVGRGTTFVIRLPVVQTQES